MGWREGLYLKTCGYMDMRIWEGRDMGEEAEN